jgi:hypothetical protein
LKTVPDTHSLYMMTTGKRLDCAHCRWFPFGAVPCAVHRGSFCLHVPARNGTREEASSAREMLLYTQQTEEPRYSRVNTFHSHNFFHWSNALTQLQYNRFYTLIFLSSLPDERQRKRTTGTLCCISEQCITFCPNWQKGLRYSFKTSNSWSTWFAIASVWRNFSNPR